MAQEQKAKQDKSMRRGRRIGDIGYIRKRLEGKED